MTLIIGYENNSNVYLASDSMGSCSETETKRHYGKKIVKIKNFMVAYAGSYRVSQLIYYQTQRFIPVTKETDVFHFVQELKKLLDENGFKKESSSFEEEPAQTASLLIATPVGLFEMAENYQFLRTNIAAMGTGENFAIGYLRSYVKMRGKDIPRAMKESILEASSYFTTIGGDAHLEIIKKTND